MKSRRRIAFPKAQDYAENSLQVAIYSRDLRPAEWGSPVILRGSKPQGRMSALGQKQTFHQVRVMSALPPKADIAERDQDLGFVPEADISISLDHLVGTTSQR